MSIESELHALSRSIEVQPTPAAESPAPGQEQPAHSAEHVRSTEAVFVREAQQGDAAGVLGLWSAGVFLNELIKDAKAKKAEEESGEEPDQLQSFSPKSK